MFPLVGPRIFYDADGGGGGSGDESFNKEQVEQIVQGRLAKLQQDLQQTKRELEAAKKNTEMVTTLQRQLEELRLKLAEKDPQDPPPDDVEGRLKLLESRHNRELDNLKKELDKEKTEREKERSRRQTVERDNEIIIGLREAGCREDAMDVGKAFFLSSITYEAEEDKWVFRLRKGGVVSVREGISEELPDYLKESSMRGGGSGSTQGTKDAAKRKRIESEKEKLKTYQDRANKTGADSDVLAYQKQKRTVQMLEQELASS